MRLSDWIAPQMRLSDWISPRSTPATKRGLVRSNPLLALAIVLAVGGVFTGAFFVGLSRGGGTVPTKADAAQAAGTAFPAGGKQFVATCGSCHTLKAAGTSGTSGPSLDATKPTAEVVLKKIETGGPVMPKGLLTGKPAEEVAAYVADVAGK